MANGELADRDEGQAQSPLCRGPRPHRRWGHRSGSGIRASNIYRAMKPGLSANTAAQAKEKTDPLRNLPAATDLRTLAATIKARWICEQSRSAAESRSLGSTTS